MIPTERRCGGWSPRWLRPSVRPDDSIGQCFSRSRRQRLGQVRPQVLDVLDADRQPDQALGDGGSSTPSGDGAPGWTRPRRGWWRRPRGRAASTNAAAVAASASSTDISEPKPPSSGPRPRARDRRAVRGSGPAARPGARPAARPAPGRWPGRVEPQGQGPQAAQRQVGLHRPGRRTVQLRTASSRCSRAGSPADQRAEQRVGVPGDELGHRVQHDVGAHSRGRWRRGVAKVLSTTVAPARAGRRRSPAGRPPRWSGWWATPARRGPPPRPRPAPRRCRRRPPSASGARRVRPARRRRRPRRGSSWGQHHHAAGGNQLEHGVSGGHPAGEGQCAAALQGADPFLQGRPGRVPVAAVAEFPLAGRLAPT